MEISSHRFCIEKRFRFLSDWDPVALMTPCFDTNSYLPIHYSTDCQDIQSFLLALDAGMRHNPTKLGFAFTEGKDEDVDTREIPYHKACNKFGEEKVRREVLDRIMKCPETNTDRFLLSAAVDEAINLDGLYILVRREPAALQRLLQGRNNKNPNQLLLESSGKRTQQETEGDDRSSSNKRSKQNSNNGSDSDGDGESGSRNDSSKDTIEKT